MTKLLRKPMVIASIVTTVVLLIAWWFAWMQPEANKLSAIHAQELRATEQVASLRSELALLRSEQKVVRAASPFLSLFGAAIPPVTDQPALVVQLYHLAVRTGVRLESVTDDTVTPGTTYSTIPVAISISGGHNAVESFIKGMYSLPRLLTIQSLSLSGTGNLNSSGSTPYTASISATAYTTADLTPPAGAS